MSAEPRGVMSRRGFVRVAGVAGAGLVVGFSVPSVRRAAGKVLEAADPFQPNAWLRIGADGAVRLTIDELEMGQGVVNALPMIVAEELDVEVAHVETTYGPKNPAGWPRSISTGGSTSVRTSWEPVRTAAAQAREMLKTAAAERWGADASALRTRDGHVLGAGGRRLAYGDLVDAASALPVPEEVPLKHPSEFRILGTYVPRSDTPEKVDGSKRYGFDVQLPGMKVAVVARPPAFGGGLRALDDSEARKSPGVSGVTEIQAGVAVLADDTWSAIRGRDALKLEWNEGPLGLLSSEDLARELKRLAHGSDAVVAREEGEAVGTLSRAQELVEADYTAPYLAHACMEPMNCTAHVRGDGAEVWAPTQNATGTQETAAEITGLDVESIVVHAIPMGGGFGRRSNTDFVREAVELSMKVGGPVKVVWTREDDTRGGFYRSVAHHRLRAALGADRRPVAWDHQVAAPSLLSQIRPSALERTGGWDFNSLLGARDLPYAIPNLRVAHARSEVQVPLWWWRSVGHSHNAFATECFLDELAEAAGRDPVEYRRTLLADEPRLRGVVERAAGAAGWGSSVATGRGRGIACHACFGSYVAQVAEVSVEDDGRVVVHRVTSALDCGQIVNPNTIEAQQEGAIVYGLGAVLHGEITLENGRVKQSNFHDYPVLRMQEMPEVDVQIVESGEAPGGVGETGTPCVAPAVVNAVYAATGVRVRSLPIRREVLRGA